MGLIRNTYRVLIAGSDVTDRFRPRLKTLSIDRAAGQAADSANITLANPNGDIVLPSDRAPITIELAGMWAFEGFVTEVECKIDKSAGRTMEIVASSVDQGAKAKEPTLQHRDDATFAEVARAFGGSANLDVQVIGDLANYRRPYWLQQNESFISWGQRVARETGATFKVIGGRAFFAARNEGLSASGRPLTPIRAAFGENLIAGSLRPIVSRPRFNNVKVSYFDIARGEKVEESFDTGIGDVDASLRTLVTAADRQQAQQRATALGRESDRESGQGDVTIIGDPRAEPEATCTVVGIAPGADGTYRIDAVAHRLTQGGSGFQTSLTLRQPQNGAGKDPREPARPAGGVPVPTPRPA